MKCKIEIDMSSAAFDLPTRYVSVREILTALLGRLEHCDVLEYGGTLILRDANGNECGKATVDAFDD